MNEILAYIAVSFSGVTLLVLVGEKLFGGGNALAAKFHALDREMSAAISALRMEQNQKLSDYEKVSTVGFEAVRANIHAIQLGLLEFRAKMAEEYIAKGGLDDIKSDMRRGFADVNQRMGELQDMIMWAQPAQHGAGEPYVRKPTQSR